MQQDFFQKCVSLIIDEDAQGYSYVDDLMCALATKESQTHINNIVVVWHVKYSEDNEREFKFYSNNQYFKLDSFNTRALAERQSIISSEDKEFSDYRVNDNLSMSHVVAIPINKFVHDERFVECHGVMIMLSQTSKINISDDQLKVFHTLLNTREPKVYTTVNVVEAFRQLSFQIEPGELSYLKCFNYIGKSLDLISNKGNKDYLLAGLRHYSFWQLRKDDEDKLAFAKEFSRNTYDNVAYNNTHTKLASNTPHYLNEVVGDALFGNDEKEELLTFLSYNEAKNSFKDENYFKSLGLSDSNSTIAVIAMGKGTSRKINCLYIKNIVYSVFVSKKLIMDYVKEIVRRINEENVRSQNILLGKLMSVAFACETELDFYMNAASIIRTANEAEQCLIFMPNNKGKLILKSEKIKRLHMTAVQEMNSPKLIGLPKNLCDDEDFCMWLDRKDFYTIPPVNTAEYYETEKNAVVKSAMVVRISAKNIYRGLIVLINMNHEPSSQCVFYHNIFITDNYLLTNACGLFLIQYQQLRASIAKRNYLLGKLRHEIPSNTDAIEQSVMAIRDCLDEPIVRKNYLYTILNNLRLNNGRILLLAKFFSAVGFPKEKFAERKKKTNLRRFLNSYIDIFRTEGKYRGVDVYFSVSDDDITINVSNFYELAIVNVVTNAIRYAAEGTCVNIAVYPDRFIVCDMGLPIGNDEKQYIFDEGFRGDLAKSINEKGMGYGLFLTKIILEAHNSEIFVDSEKYCDENYFGEIALCDYIDRLGSTIDQKNFIVKGMSEANRSLALKLYDSMIKNRNANIDRAYRNFKPEIISEWVDYLNENNVVFHDLESDIMREVHKVKFTIKF